MRDVSHLRSTTARQATSLGMTKGSIFNTLDVYHDVSPCSAAMNMAIDEALLGTAEAPSIRFYRWNFPALSFGYFGRFADVIDYAAKRDLVRRWTGGGIVLHGDDLTYSIIVPACDPVFAESSKSIYAGIHTAVRDALVVNGEPVELAVTGRDAALLCQSGSDRPPTAQRAIPTSVCFANPVYADVLVNGRKVAGAAHRRTRTGLLHQGSIQHVNLTEDFPARFAHALGEECFERGLNSGMVERAVEISAEKYATQAWLQRR